MLLLHRLAKFKKTDGIKYWWECWETDIPVYYWLECIVLTLKTIWQKEQFVSIIRSDQVIDF